MSFSESVYLLPSTLYGSTHSTAIITKHVNKTIFISKYIINIGFETLYEQ
jgi:hypothetical protein